MMKTVIIQGSPREGGNTEHACRHLANGLREHSVVSLMNLRELSIRKCLGCQECLRTGEGCVIDDDDFAGLWEQVRQSDILIQAAPVYWHSPPGLMKDFIDRTLFAHRANRVKKCLAGKKGAIITVAAAGGFEPCEGILAVWAAHYGVDIEKKIRLRAEHKGDLENDPDELSKLDKLVEEMLQHGPLPGRSL